MPANIQTASLAPVGGRDNGDGTQSLTVFESGINISGATQVLALSATAQVSSAIGTSGTPSQVRVIGSAAFYLAVGAAPVATSASPYFGVNPTGQIINVPGGQKLSALQAGSGGNVWITVV